MYIYIYIYIYIIKLKVTICKQEDQYHASSPFDFDFLITISFNGMFIYDVSTSGLYCDLKRFSPVEDADPKTKQE